MIDEKLNEQLIYVITILIQCHTIKNYTLRELSVNIFFICKHPISLVSLNLFPLPAQIFRQGYRNALGVFSK